MTDEKTVTITLTDEYAEMLLNHGIKGLGGMLYITIMSQINEQWCARNNGAGRNE